MPIVFAGWNSVTRSSLWPTAAPDRTQEIARQFGARVIDGIFPLESQCKAAGVSACLGEWVLEVEADETVEAALAYEVRAAIHAARQATGSTFRWTTMWARP